MTVERLAGADVANDAPPTRVAGSAFFSDLVDAFGETGRQFARADAAERAFAAGSGSLTTMVLERAQAGVALSIASAAASRVAQGVSTLLGMAL